MASQDLDDCLSFILLAEGGYVDNPADPGSATNYGITLATLSLWRHTAVTKQDVQNLTVDEAKNIYTANYWNVIRGDDLPPGIDLMVLDAGVNMGTGRSAKFLQSVIDVAQDGAIGSQTLGALTNVIAVQGAGSIITQLADLRANFYRSLPTFATFGHGWLRRIANAQAQALILTSSEE